MDQVLAWRGRRRCGGLLPGQAWHNGLERSFLGSSLLLRYELLLPREVT
jgi:hypothetical protein